MFLHCRLFVKLIIIRRYYINNQTKLKFYDTFLMKIKIINKYSIFVIMVLTINKYENEQIVIDIEFILSCIMIFLSIIRYIKIWYIKACIYCIKNNGYLLNSLLMIGSL